jgi:2-methylcitrate dehydratase PrpD
VPTPALNAAKRCLVDVLGVSLAGTATDVARLACAIAERAYAPGPCTVVGSTARFAPIGAAFANATAAHALDFDDTCYAGIVHGSAVVGPAAIAASESAQATGKDFLVAFIAGIEVESALGKALTDSLYYKGWFNTAVLGAVGAAAAAAKAMGLGPDAIGRAISIAACQANGLRVSLGTQTKPYLAGRASETGMHAATFAAAGMDAPAQAFEEERGFIRVLNEGRFDSTALDRLGCVFSLLTPGIAFKRYPVCSAAQAAAEAVERLLAEEGIDGRHVRKVICEVTRLVYISLTYERPATIAEAQFSMPFAIGCILAFGRLGVDTLTDETLADSRLHAAMEKVEMRLASPTDGQLDGHLLNPEAARVTVLTADGRTFSLYNGAATGMPNNPAPDAALAKKFRRCARTALTPTRAEAWLERLWSVETLPDVTAMFSY